MYKVVKEIEEREKMNIIIKVITVILYIIIIPIIIFNFTLIIKSFINPNQIPDFLGYKNFIIISGSMEPTIMTGDAIFVEKVPQNEIKINDIISFRDGESITTHRIVDVIEENGIKKYKTKGDNNNVEDKDMVFYSQIEGKYKFKINGFGKVLEFLKNKVTLTILIFLMIVMYFYSARIEHKKKKRKEKRIEYNSKLKM